MHDTIQSMNEAVAAIRERSGLVPRVAVVLGSGLGGIARDLADAQQFDYTDIPHFPHTTAVGHRGRLVLGQLVGVPVAVMQGRFHLYEGYSPQQTSFPIRVLRALGADTLVVTNAAGGVNPSYRVGDLMVILDHINWMFRNPLVGANDPRLGPRWPDMSRPYDPELAEVVFEAARRHRFSCHRGTYVGMLGPTYETRAEYRMVRRLGGDVVGMSTIPETIVAVQLGMRVVGLSTITNSCCPDDLSPTSGEQVIAAAVAAADKVQVALEAVVSHLR